MILSLIVIVVAGMIAYIWSARGFFSSFLHMLCVIAAGAIAFALWEPLALWMLSSDTSQGGTLIDLAWGVALGVPFAIILTILRVACDKIVPFNLDFDGPANLVGGLGCGAVSGTITAGILVMSVGFTRLDTEFLGHKPVIYSTSGGSLVRGSGLYFPADKLTAWFYGALSNGTLVPTSSDAQNRPFSLGRMHPELADEGPMLRVNWEDGKAKSTLPPSAFEVLARQKFEPANAPESLFGDSFEVNRKDTFEYLTGEKASAANSYIESFVVSFKAGAKEQSGRIVVGTGQIRLLVQRDANDPYSTMSITPVSVVSQATGDKPLYGRWRYNAPNVFISSVGGRDDAPMAFEFVTPKGATPIALYVKGVRFDVSAMQPSAAYSSQTARDDAFRSGAYVPTTQSKPIEWGRAVKMKGDTASLGDSTLVIRQQMPFSVTLQKDILYGLEVDDTNSISGGGLAKFDKKDIAPFGTDPKLQVRKFSVSDDTNIVQVIMDGKNKQFGFLSDAAAGYDREAAPVVVDSSGQQYSAIGYVYKGAGQTWIYFNPQAPLKSTIDRELPILTRSQPDQELVLIFRVSKNVKIKGVAIGSQGLVEFQKPEPEVK